MNTSAGLRVPTSWRFPIRCPLFILAVLAAALSALVLALPGRSAVVDPPPWFVEQALCVHSGWHYTRQRQHGPPEYVLWGHGYWRTWDVPDSTAGGSGEGPWAIVNGYGGGMQFTLGTWNRAGAPYASSTSDIARAPASEQIRRAFVIVTGDGGSWREWPNTSRACGLR